jgi:hypothetical protein
MSQIASLKVSAIKLLYPFIYLDSKFVDISHTTNLQQSSIFLTVKLYAGQEPPSTSSPELVLAGSDEPDVAVAEEPSAPVPKVMGVGTVELDSASPTADGRT